MMKMTMQALLNSAENADGIAIECENRRYTYKEYNAVIANIADNLTDKFGQNNVPVIVCMKQSEKMVMAIMGIIKAGMTFIIVSTNYPENRKNFIKEESGAVLFLTDDNFDEWTVKNSDSHREYRQAQEQDLSAIYYTSGSTGVPKGIRHTQESLANGAVAEGENRISIIANEKTETMFAINDIGFIFGSMPMFQALLFGKKLVVITEEEKALTSLIAKKMQKEKAFTVMTTPSIIQNYLLNDTFIKAMKNCKLLVTAGEKLNQTLADKICSLYPDGLMFINLLGCTECGFGFSIDTVKKGAPVTCGRGMKDVWITVRDENGVVLPPNTKGEIYIAGVRVSSGYVSASEEDMQRFFMENGRYCYKSGDLGYIDDLGRLIYCGRNNKMVKLHGTRVDLNEVEKRLEECNGVRNAAVKVFTRNDEDYACAFYTGDKPVDEKQLCRELLENLTRAMIPSVFVYMEALPANDRGKVDYNALTPPESKAPDLADREREIYTEDRLNILCRGVEDVLGISVVKKEDDFFELGGDSLRALTLISYLYDQGYKLTVKQLYENSILMNVADALETVNDESFDNLFMLENDDVYEAKYPAEENELYYLSLPEAHRDILNFWIRYKLTLSKSWSESEFYAVLDRLYVAHPVLRTEFKKEDAGLFHYILKDKKPNAVYRDLTAVPKDEQDRVLSAYQTDKSGFAGGGDELSSFACFKTGEQECVLFLKLSHAIVDGISIFNVLIQNLLSDGKAIKRDDYHDYKNWLCKKREDLSDAKLFFVDYLGGIKNTSLPHKKNNNPNAINVGTERIVIERETLSKLSDRLQKTHNTVSEAVMFAYMKSAVDLSGGEEFTALNLFSGRTDEIPSSNDVVGYITAGIPLRVKNTTTLSQFADDLRTLGTYPYATFGVFAEAVGAPFRVNDGITSDLFMLTDEALIDIQEIYDKSIRLGHRFFMEGDNLVIELRYNLEQYESSTFAKLANSMRMNLS